MSKKKLTKDTDEIKDAIRSKKDDAVSKNDLKNEERISKGGKSVEESAVIKQKDAKIAELTDDIKRLQADFENYKKRCEKENQAFREYAKADLVKKLLTVLDSFEMALKNTEDKEEFVKGVELIYSQLYGLLKEEGLEAIETKDKRFDPYFHEVMMTVSSDHDDAILEEFQKGYTFKGQVLRHSKVKVGKKK